MAIIATDLDGCIRTFNIGAERMLGYAAAEVVGQHTPLLFHDATGAPLYAPYPLSIAVPAMLAGHLMLAGVAEGRSNAAIARTLGTSVRTVESHVTSILRTLGIPDSPDAHRRVLAALAFVQGGQNLG